MITQAHKHTSTYNSLEKRLLFKEIPSFTEDAQSSDVDTSSAPNKIAAAVETQIALNAMKKARIDLSRKVTPIIPSRETPEYESFIIDRLRHVGIAALDFEDFENVAELTPDQFEASKSPLQYALNIASIGIHDTGYMSSVVDGLNWSKDQTLRNFIQSIDTNADPLKYHK